jgi:hypothetical protein
MAGVEVSYFDTLCELYDIEFVDRNYGWASCLHDLSDTKQFGIIKTIDAGESWTFLPFGIEGYMLRDIIFTSSVIGYGIAIPQDIEPNLYYSTEIYPISGILVKTLDGGSSWNVLEATLPGEVTYVSFIDENRGWIVCNNDGDTQKPIIMGTTNGGENWTLLYTHHRAVHDFRVIDENTLVFGCGAFFGTSDGDCLSFWRSTDGGNAWNEEQGDGKEGLFRTRWHSPNRIIPTPEGSAFWFISRDYTRLFPSSELWFYDLDRAFDRPNGYIGDLVTRDETSAIILNTDSEGIQAWLSSTVNCGEDFKFLADLPAFVYKDFELNISVKKIAFSDTNMVWISGWLDKLVRYTFETEVTTVDNPLPQSLLPALHTPFPNPFNLSTTITFKLLEKSLVELAVFDVTGRKVATIINNEPFSAGLYYAVFDAHGLASGAYYCCLHTDQAVKWSKMVILK